MNRISMVSLVPAALVAWACGSAIKAEGDTSADPTPDAADGLDTAVDTDAIDIPLDVPPDGIDDTTDPAGCTPDETRCSADGLSIEHCRSDGSGWDSVECAFDCVSDPDPRCRAWIISNIPEFDLLSAGEDPVSDPWPGEDDLRAELDTDTGAVTVYRTSDDSLVTEVRPPGIPGLHAGSGIHFAVVSQGTDGPELGVFSFQRLDVPVHYTFQVAGSRPLVLLSEEDATIAGGVHAGCILGAGGASSNGEGAGAGTSGGSIPGGGGARDGGGGGGAFGGSGGDGGAYSPEIQGIGGSPYGTRGLIPLLAGSGGGDGGGTGGGRWGGPSGGAVEIVSGGTLTITGWVDASGCGGMSAYYSPEGGGGGGSGGGILLEARALVITGTVTTNGGGGASGGGGGDDTAPLYGEDGHIGYDVRALGGRNSHMYSCNGGNGNGGGAAAGEDAPACDSSNPNNFNAGGGGGSAGRIRLNGMDRDLTGLLSPAMTSDATTEDVLNLV